MTACESGDALLCARDLALGYGGEAVVRGLSLEVRQGDFWCLLGSNGSGKTTFVRAVLGILEPLAGALWLHPVLASRERTGFVPQRCELNPALPTTVREFVLLGLVGTEVPAAERRERLAETLDRLGLAGLARHDYWALSGGQRQRALVARALIRRPSLLILDEPMNHLDYHTEESLLRELVGMNRRGGLTLIVVTHDVEIACRHASHVAYFRDGAVVAGARDRVLEQVPSFTAHRAAVAPETAGTDAPRQEGQEARDR